MPSPIRLRRAATVAVAATAPPFFFAQSALANWSSHITGADVGFESRRWAEESYTEVNFKGCNNSRQDISVGIEIYEDINNWPDDGYGEKTFTACFNGGTSKGTESGLPAGSYYFQIEAHDGIHYTNLYTVNVSSVSVDTTLAD
ncbi:MAG TPA: hypothetical protein VK659_05135 [Asanoa sp.]|nr:hypothetical protein [Asanoa sp.]